MTASPDRPGSNDHSKRLALITSELGEALEALRKDRKGILQKDTFEDELATAFIKLCDLCKKIDLDLEKFIELKLAFNKTRNEKHNKLF